MYLSVIIPSRNRAALLELTLKSLMNQTYSREHYEIIIIDNASTDNTREIVKIFKPLFLNIIYAYEPKLGLHFGRHLGLKLSKGDILVYADDDIEAFPTWLEGIAESFRNPDVALVGGNNLPKYETPPPSWVEKLWEKTDWGITIGALSLIDFNHGEYEISPFYVYGCNFSIRKKTLLEVGGFHPDGMPDELLRYRGDGETAVSGKIFLKGYKTIFNSKASVYHYVSTLRMTPQYIYKRGYLQGVTCSYSEIRKNGGLSYNNFINNCFHSLLRICVITISGLWKKDIDVNLLYQKGFSKGYFYHQVTSFFDKKIIEWMQKPNYLE